jgi:hypothetical protein
MSGSQLKHRLGLPHANPPRGGVLKCRMVAATVLRFPGTQYMPTSWQVVPVPIDVNWQRHFGAIPILISAVFPNGVYYHNSGTAV